MAMAMAMTDDAKRVQRVYLALTLLSTLAASFIWGINTLFLLDAGLSNTEAFAANAFFTAGQVLFEVPTGVVADIWGRRTSYLLGAATLLLSTLLYLGMWHARAPMWGWAVASMLLGLGFTFFSGATEAWLADALAFTGAKDDLDAVLARGQTVAGAAMLTGAVGGGFIAQLTNLGVPYVIRSVLLGLTLAVAVGAMKDLGFVPDASLGPLKRVRGLLRGSIDYGLRKPPIRWLMLAAPFTMGVGFFAFYAMQPYLLQLYGNQGAFGVAGLAAAAVAGSQIDRDRGRLFGGAGVDVPLLGCRRAAHHLGTGRRRVHATAPGVSQRVDPLGAEGDHLVLRQLDGIGGRCRYPAGVGARR